GHDLLAAASRVRRARERRLAPAPHGAGPVRLAHGGQRPTWICVPALVPPANPLVYRRLADAAAPSEVWALAHPGYAEGESLPLDRAALIRGHADAIRSQIGGEELVLIAYSSGGWVAHEVAACLERAGAFPRALVLLDTYLRRDLSAELSARFTRAWATDGSASFVRDHELTALPWYLELFSDWSPGPIATPTLLVQSADPVPGPPLADWQARWPHPHDVREVPGNHFTIITESSHLTAKTVHDWLATVPSAAIAGGARAS
ncbi:MAG TPA: alpha/beta fold hydrolase, partial [Kofleriaceae bacterium]|nr:alpha/beta fold hydrolase [Kofleriaceae bacterium]